MLPPLRDDNPFLVNARGYSAPSVVLAQRLYQRLRYSGDRQPPVIGRKLRGVTQCRRADRASGHLCPTGFYPDFTDTPIT
ncbi:hypothetical protein VR7878_00397 [Vibrio ruber DSM 16370]|uniref:Uncharacterized protein n=1 Tax=Vibrio ruber (strain DSM 16370 / JCM 11486 / BCRC 17186 / CECT 7878 / LMG 23124 / VR1) TaxID=1123498 RepID=A0A1R4LAI9_VIBR1|nr:hypothetical protein VR7878_00397 [Vibrio ruber DSM 16370]